MRISVIIATLGRPDHVKTLIKSLSENTRLPDEVLLIEQVNTQPLEALVASVVDVPIKVIFQKEKSASQARQRGADESVGDVLVFLDDDMIVGKDYLNIVGKHLSREPNTLGLTGSYMKGEKAWTIKRVLGVFFGVYSWRSQNIVLYSGSNDYIRGRNLKYEQTVEWLYGGNMVLRRSIFEEGYAFNPNFLRWSFGEDVMLTYSINKKYPKSLRYLPELEVKHNHGVGNKILNIQATRMKIIYRYIFWQKEVYQGRFLSLLAYLWSQIGLSGLEILQYPSFSVIKTLGESYLYLFNNRKSILSEKVDYNSFILQNKI